MKNETTNGTTGAPDDPRLTAWALGELEGAEREAFETELAAAADGGRAAAGEAAAVRAIAGELEEALAGEAGHDLGVVRRTKVLGAAEDAAQRTETSMPRRWGRTVVALGTLAAAAVVLVALGIRLLQASVVTESAVGTISSSDGALVELEGLGYLGGPSVPLSPEQQTMLRSLGYMGDEPGPSSPRRPMFVTRKDGRVGVIDLDGFGSEAGKPTYDPLGALRHPSERPGTEAYDSIRDNPFLSVTEAPLSTFSISPDTASYANVRRFLSNGQLPPPDAVRIEELVNYFRYDEPLPPGAFSEHPFAVGLEVASAPWRPEHRLVRVGLKGREIPVAERRPTNLVFLLDVSGSMDSPDKLPLVKGAMRLLVDQLDERDRVAIVVYAGAAGLVLPPTSCADRPAVLHALEALSAGGSTNGGQGLRLAYRVARDNLLEGGVNRVILCTDGDFNVGTSSEGELARLVDGERKHGVSLSVLGFGTGNLKDSTMSQLARKSDGNYAYVDSLREARRVLVEEMGGTLETIAKDVKIQVEFNPAEVKAYRLIGYETRLLAARDFNDDRVDAGEIGAGHAVTALYEVVPVGAPTAVGGVDPLRYQDPARASADAGRGELLTVKLRYKRPDEDTSRLIETPLVDPGTTFDAAGTDLRFAGAVAAFGMLLRGSEHAGDATLRDVLRWAVESQGPDRGGYRAELLELVTRALRLGPTEPPIRADLEKLGDDR